MTRAESGREEEWDTDMTGECKNEEICIKWNKNEKLKIKITQKKSNKRRKSG